MIILIEDEETLAELYDIILSKIDHKVCRSLEELEQVPEQVIKDAQCVITDMYLKPGVTALNIKDYIKDINPTAKVLLMTGGIIDPDTVKQFDYLLLKPFPCRTLKSLCQTYINPSTYEGI